MKTDRKSQRVFGSFVAISAVLALAATLAPISSAADAAVRRKTRTTEPSFKAVCDFVRTASDDPIVFPGQPGIAHAHDFFGTLSTSSTMRVAELAAAGTTCNNEADRSAYWAPSLISNGRAITPTHLAAYYFGSPATVKPYPEGLRVIAGNATGTTPQDSRTWSLGCAGQLVDPSKEPCPEGSNVVLTVRFPNCWDGSRIDSRDHKSHMARSDAAGNCPSRHPVLVPTLVMIVHYPLQDGRGVTLSSGELTTAHADFINGWEPATLKTLIDDCLNQAVVCR